MTSTTQQDLQESVGATESSVSDGSLNVLFFGCCVREEDSGYLAANERRRLLAAAQRACWMLVKGLDSAMGRDADMLCSMSVSRFPLFRKLIPFRLPSWKRKDGAEGHYVKYVNLPGLCYLTSALSALTGIIRWAIRRKAAHRVVVVYAMYTPHMLATIVAARLFGLRTLLIMPDVVEYMQTRPMKLPERILRAVNNGMAKSLARRFDGYVFFTARMFDYIKPGEKPWTVIEGCMDPASLLASEASFPPPVKRYFLYSGNTTISYGLDLLLEAFALLRRDDCELLITGTGLDSDKLARLAAPDPRIRILGLLPKMSDVFALQRGALALINPRQGRDDFTHYSFPSKNLEFMASGRPTIICTMNGMPPEYSDYVLAADGDGAEALAHKMREVLETDETALARLGASARDFVLNEKNYHRQGRRLFDIIKQTTGC